MEVNLTLLSLLGFSPLVTFRQDRPLRSALTSQSIPIATTFHPLTYHRICHLIKIYHLSLSYRPLPLRNNECTHVLIMPLMRISHLIASEPTTAQPIDLINLTEVKGSWELRLAPQWSRLAVRCLHKVSKDLDKRLIF